MTFGPHLADFLVKSEDSFVTHILLTQSMYVYVLALARPRNTVLLCVLCGSEQGGVWVEDMKDARDSPVTRGLLIFHIPTVSVAQILKPPPDLSFF